MNFLLSLCTDESLMNTDSLVVVQIMRVHKQSPYSAAKIFHCVSPSCRKLRFSFTSKILILGFVVWGNNVSIRCSIPRPRDERWEAEALHCMYRNKPSRTFKVYFICTSSLLHRKKDSGRLRRSQNSGS